MDPSQVSIICRQTILLTIRVVIKLADQPLDLRLRARLPVYASSVETEMIDGVDTLGHH